MKRYWMCRNEECPKFDKDVFTAVPQLAICPVCESLLHQLDDVDPEERMAQLASRMSNEWLAKTYRAALKRESHKHSLKVAEVEIRRRAGAVDPRTWMEAQLR